MYFLGIDWANDKHDLCLLADDGRILSQFVVTHDLAGFATLQDHLKTLPDLRINKMIPGIGHWTQQEAPDAVNEIILDFLKQVN